MGESGPSLINNGQKFFPKKWPKNAIFGPKTVFFGLRWSVQHPPTLFCRCSTPQAMCCRIRNPKIGDVGPPHPKCSHFCAQKWHKNDNFWQNKHCFLRLDGQYKPPHPIVQMLDAKKHVLKFIGAGK